MLPFERQRQTTVGFWGANVGFPMNLWTSHLGHGHLIFQRSWFPESPPPRKLLESNHNFRVQNGTKINNLKFVDSQMAFFLNEKKVMFQVFSASMSSFMGVKSTQNKTCCLAEVNLELMDDPLGPIIVGGVSGSIKKTCPKCYWRVLHERGRILNIGICLKVLYDLLVIQGEPL